MKTKIGVYICHCGGNISDYVDVEKVREAVKNEDGILMSKTTVFACADSSQNEMISDIKNNNIEAFVVASCSPKLHLPTFQAVAERAGLNKFNYVHANIREQVSWAHSDDKEGATAKAIQIVRASIAKVRLSEAIEPVEIKTQQSVLVVGAGVSGMKAATSLSQMGIQVHLIEKDHFVGGRISHWDVLCTTDETSKDLVTRLYNEVITDKNIKLYTGTELVDSTGSKGDFKVKLKSTPRYIDSCDANAIKNAIEVCPIEVDDEFNFKITKRKAIYHNFPSQFPQSAVIDMDNCNRCGECSKHCSSVDLDQKEGTFDINVGTVLVATGFDPYTPQTNEFGYGVNKNIITLPEFKRLVANSDKELIWNDKKIKSISYIYCVGSRQPEGDNKYCSRYCCTTTIYSAIKAQEKFGDIDQYHITRGVRTYGKQESLYFDALKGGQVFLQSQDDDMPVVEEKDGKTIITLKDVLSSRKTMEVESDLVVLVTGMVPRAGANISEILKIPKGRDSFYNEIHMKLRPVETVIDGITIAGACQGPKNIEESINSSLSAAIKSYSFVSKETLLVEPLVAEIDKDKCTWCGECEDICEFDAITKTTDGGREIADINFSVCKGCGHCLPVCEPNAIQLKNFSDDEVEHMIAVLANEL